MFHCLRTACLPGTTAEHTILVVVGVVLLGVVGCRDNNLMAVVVRVVVVIVVVGVVGIGMVVCN